MTSSGARTRALAVCVPGMWALVVQYQIVAVQVGWVVYVVAHHAAVDHGPPLAPEAVVGGPPRVAAYQMARVDLLGDLAGVGSAR